jgi:hypothetical protein
MIVNLKDLAESAARHHYHTVTSLDSYISNPESGPYRRSAVLLLAAVAAAYPHVDPDRVLEAWSARYTPAPVAHCVRVVEHHAAREVTARLTTAVRTGVLPD